MPELAEEEARSLRFWFRQCYNLPPTDPRYLGATDEEICLDYEAHLAFQGNPLKTCGQCGKKTHRNQCPRCVDVSGEPLELTGDAVLDALNARHAAGETLDSAELEKALRGGFEPVPKGEAP